VKDRRSAPRRAGVALALASIALLAGACASDNAGGVSSGGSVAPPDTAALGTPRAASGEPVVVGLISASKADGALAAQFKAVETGMSMAVEYANGYRGGIAGRPIEMFICQGGETPAGTQDCANQMVNKGVDLVLTPFTGNGASVVPIVTAAGIPYVTMTGAASQELTGPGAFSLSAGFPGLLAGYAAHAKEAGVKKFALMANDTPAVISGANALGKLVFKNAGVDFEITPVPVGTADMTPQLQAAVSGGATALGIVGDLTFCSSFLQAYQTLGLTQARYLLATCVEPTTTATYGDVIDGSIMSGQGASTGEATTDEKLYAAMVQKYASGKGIDPDPAVSTQESLGVIPMMTVVGLMDGVTGDVNAASILERLRAAKAVPLFLGDGASFTCDGSVIPLFKNVCSATTAVGTADAAGKLKDAKRVDTAPLFKT
jgi:branched-chain amino acid transport system substrate-binding protein